MKFIGDEKNSSGNEFEKILSHTIVFNMFLELDLIFQQNKTFRWRRVGKVFKLIDLP